jgi:hypothetical protein
LLVERAHPRKASCAETGRSENLMDAQDESSAAEGLQKVTTVKLQWMPLDVLGFLPLFKTFKHSAGHVKKPISTVCGNRWVCHSEKQNTTRIPRTLRARMTRINH